MQSLQTEIKPLGKDCSLEEATSPLCWELGIRQNWSANDGGSVCLFLNAIMG